MARKIEIESSGGTFTALTVDSNCTSKVTSKSVEKYTGVTMNNKWDEIITGSTLDNDKAKLVASNNSVTSSREGYGVIKYVVNGNACEKIIHVVQEAATPTPIGSGFKAKVNVPTGKASAYVSLYDASNTFLCGISRYQGGTGTAGEPYTWTAHGTVTKIAVNENHSNCKYLTINGKTGTTYLAKTQINYGGTVTTLDLTRTFDTSDYNDGNAKLYFTFEDS